MNEEERRKEYEEKIWLVREEYRTEFTEFMKRRREYKRLDQGVREENAIRKKFYDRLTELGEEYSDVIKK